MSAVSHNVDGFDSCPVEIKKINNLYYLICKRLNIIEFANTFDEALEKLNKARVEYLSKLKSLGIEYDLTAVDQQYPNAFVNSKSNKNSDRLFVKMSIAITIVVLLAYYSIGMITNTVSQKIAAVENKILTSIKSKLGDPKNVTVLLNEAANTLENITPERKLQIQMELRRMVKSVQPIADELKPLYQDNTHK